MSTTMAVSGKPRVLAPILIGGSIAGALDLAAAFITFGPRVPKAIAGGLSGTKAF